MIQASRYDRAASWLLKLLLLRNKYNIVTAAIQEKWAQNTKIKLFQRREK